MIPIILDTETIGFAPPMAHVVQIGAVALVPGSQQEFYSLSNPGESVMFSDFAESSLQYNGLDRNDILNAPDVSVVAFQFRRWFQSIQDEFVDKVNFFAYNYRFDQRMLLVKPWDLVEQQWSDEDVMEMARILMCNSEKGYAWPNKPPKLVEAIDGLDIELKGRNHDALFDAQVTTEIYKMFVKFKEDEEGSF